MVKCALFHIPLGKINEGEKMPGEQLYKMQGTHK